MRLVQVQKYNKVMSFSKKYIVERSTEEREEVNKVRGLLNFRKGIHVKLFESTLNDFRVELFKRGLSMQDAFEELARLISSQDSQMLQFLDRIALKKREKKINKVKADMTVSEKDQMLDIIGQLEKEDS